MESKPNFVQHSVLNNSLLISFNFDLPCPCNTSDLSKKQLWWQSLSPYFADWSLHCPCPPVPFQRVSFSHTNPHLSHFALFLPTSHLTPHLTSHLTPHQPSSYSFCLISCHHLPVLTSLVSLPPVLVLAWTYFPPKLYCWACDDETGLAVIDQLFWNLSFC